MIWRTDTAFHDKVRQSFGRIFFATFPTPWTMNPLVALLRPSWLGAVFVSSSHCQLDRNEHSYDTAPSVYL